jgi:phosphoenolpyruvate-protein phosphotransferase
MAVAANIDNPDEVKSVLKHGAEGIGLYRTEFLYFNRSSLPTEEEHYEKYLHVAQKMMPYGVIIRTIDIGGDKLANIGLEGLTEESNPFMGLRAIRLCLKYPQIFKTQLRGILRASAEGKIKIMYPMISGVGELRAANKILNEVKEDLRREGKKFDENIEVGAMIEVPSAALTADMIAREADFLSIGTNDLIQYTLAVDRVNENVASLYEPLHLSILRLLKSIIDAGHNAGKWVGMCGEMAADPSFTMVLAGLGLNELSVSPVQISKIKKIVRSFSLLEAKALVAEVLQSPDSETAIKKVRSQELRGLSPQ